MFGERNWALEGKSSISHPDNSVLSLCVWYFWWCLKREEVRKKIFLLSLF